MTTEAATGKTEVEGILMLKDDDDAVSAEELTDKMNLCGNSSIDADRVEKEDKTDMETKDNNMEDSIKSDDGNGDKKVDSIDMVRGDYKAKEQEISENKSRAVSEIDEQNDKSVNQEENQEVSVAELRKFWKNKEKAFSSAKKPNLVSKTSTFTVSVPPSTITEHSNDANEKCLSGSKTTGTASEYVSSAIHQGDVNTSKENTSTIKTIASRTSENILGDIDESQKELLIRKDEDVEGKQESSIHETYSHEGFKEESSKAPPASANKNDRVNVLATIATVPEKKVDLNMTEDLTQMAKNESASKRPTSDEADSSLDIFPVATTTGGVTTNIIKDHISGTCQTRTKNGGAPANVATAKKLRPSSSPVTISNVPSTSSPLSSPNNRIRLGICAKDKKARSKPMMEILSRLDDSLFEVIIFGDKRILHSPVETWPICDVLIAFYSNGYPLEKAEKYAQLRKPFVLNDLRMQRTLQDRRRVYDLLEASGIDVPRHVYMNRDGYVKEHFNSCTNTFNGNNESYNGGDFNDDNGFNNDGMKEDVLIEHDDHIEINGEVINKPFVEKPVDADDHNIAIYYPTSAGGGCKKLFRKIGDRSSEFYPDTNEVRRDGSFIYEEFVETQGTDVKMYTVGPDYGHAEARKSPTVDGKVERNSDGKEVRFPVILTLREKEIARRIVLVFKQQVCGFDLLRVQEGDSLVSYVCDVNGWSFVKNSRKYYDDCAQILTEHMLAAVKPMALQGFSALDPLMKTMEDGAAEIDTPKSRRQKKKNQSGGIGSTVLSRAFSMLQGEPLSSPDIFTDDPASPHQVVDNVDSSSLDPLLHNHLAATLQEGALPVREMPDMLMNDPASMSASSSVVGDDETVTTHFSNSATSNQVNDIRGSSIIGTHQEELRCVIAVVRHGDRTPKQKLKVHISEPHLLKYFHDHTDNCRKDLKVKEKRPMTEFLETVKLMISEKEASAKAGFHNHKKDDKDLLYKLRHMRDILERWKIGGLNRKLQIKPRKWEEYMNEDGQTEIRCVEVQLILKWGGNLTKLGERQSITLGQRLRHEMYPDSPGGGILRLHSTFRHDLKIKTSDEGRVMKTAAAFAKGLLELEGEIPPILVSLVHKEKDSLHMLDPSGNKEVKKELEACKLKVNKNIQADVDYEKTTISEHEKVVGPISLTSLHKAYKAVGNPRKTLFTIRQTIGELLEQLDDMLGVLASDMEDRNEGGEGLQGEGEGDEALCGIKLYRGETLLELTERWRLLHRKLYDEETDIFDVSRVPDVHDNVRFDMLHNPHLGLTATLEKLYTLAKLMADCVVPQEYGTTIVEKRSIANKMCSALLEKIKYDLIIARTDNQVDMRYMINMDYSADLPINTMGRRIRTRLYFTSESHLHTLLNVLRFSESGKSGLLSDSGREIISAAPELCYLTQIVIRLFENTKKDVNDPRRFRIEILFSPGASATPLHMSEDHRDLDSTRFETEARKLVSKENLTCQEVEDYFTESIKKGKIDEDDDVISNISTVDEKKKKESKVVNADKVKEKSELKSESGSNFPAEIQNPSMDDVYTAKSVLSAMANKQQLKSDIKSVKIAEEKNTEIEPVSCETEIISQTEADTIEATLPNTTLPCYINDETEEDNSYQDGGKVIDEKDKMQRMARILAKQYAWTSVAAISFVMGIGCLILSRRAMDSSRRWSRR